METNFNFLGLEFQSILILMFSVCLGGYFILFSSTRTRLARLFPWLLDKQLDKPSDPIQNKFHRKMGRDFTFSARDVHQFIMMKLYLDTGDEILIRKGSQARVMYLAFYYLVLLYCCWFIYENFIR